MNSPWLHKSYRDIGLETISSGATCEEKSVSSHDLVRKREAEAVTGTDTRELCIRFVLVLFRT